MHELADRRWAMVCPPIPLPFVFQRVMVGMTCDETLMRHQISGISSGRDRHQIELFWNPWVQFVQHLKSGGQGRSFMFRERLIQTPTHPDSSDQDPPPKIRCSFLRVQIRAKKRGTRTQTISYNNKIFHNMPIRCPSTDLFGRFLP